MTHLAHSATAPQQPRLTVLTAITGSLEIVTVVIAPTQATVQVQGELDATTTAVLTAALKDQLALGHRYVRLDLSRLSFLDCAGLRALALAHNEFLIGGGSLVLSGVGDRTARVLGITGLDEALFVADEPHLD